MQPWARGRGRAQRECQGGGTGTPREEGWRYLWRKDGDAQEKGWRCPGRRDRDTQAQGMNPPAPEERQPLAGERKSQRAAHPCLTPFQMFYNLPHEGFPLRISLLEHPAGFGNRGSRQDPAPASRTRSFHCKARKSTPQPKPLGESHSAPDIPSQGRGVWSCWRGTHGLGEQEGLLSPSRSPELLQQHPGSQQAQKCFRDGFCIHPCGS